MNLPSPSPVLLLAADAIDGFAGIAGWTIHRGFGIGDEPWDLGRARVLCVGSVASADDAAAALAVVARGAGLAVAIEAQGTVRHRFLEDLHKLSDPVIHSPEPDPAIARLTSLQRELLDALARGATVTAAADASNVSRRTANRALADARSLFGCGSNAEAVHRWAATRSSASGC
jgi:DNA-binding NarL/FixJ family response regulator